MKKITRILILAAVVALAATMVIAVRQRGADNETAGARPPAAAHPPGIIRFAAGEPQLSALRVAPVLPESLPATDPVNGRFVFDENITSRVSSPLAGRVTSLRAGVGDRVARGAPLLVIDSPDLANAEAELARADSEHLRKRLALERARRLFEHEVIARKELEAAEADFSQADADRRRAALQLRSLQASGHEDGRFVLRAPLGGTVVERNVNPGQQVGPALDAPLFVLADLGRLWLLVDLPEKSLASVRVGQTVAIETDAWPEQRFVGTVDRVGAVVDPATRRIQVRCTVPNAEGRLRPEMFARVAFLADGERHGIRVPNGALVTEGITTYVFVERQPGEFEKRRVGLALRGYDTSFVESGLAEGERVVVEGALLLNAEAAADAQ